MRTVLYSLLACVLGASPVFAQTSSAQAQTVEPEGGPHLSQPDQLQLPTHDAQAHTYHFPAWPPEPESRDAGMIVFGSLLGTVLGTIAGGVLGLLIGSANCSGEHNESATDRCITSLGGGLTVGALVGHAVGFGVGFGIAWAVTSPSEPLLDGYAPAAHGAMATVRGRF